MRKVVAALTGRGRRRVHPSDGISAVLPLADYLSQLRVAQGMPPLLMRDVLVVSDRCAHYRQRHAIPPPRVQRLRALVARLFAELLNTASCIFVLMAHSVIAFATARVGTAK